jgi:hypothetical protein
LIIDMCLASHNLWRQITLHLEGLDNPGSPGHSCRVTLQHTEAYRVTRAPVPGHPPKLHWLRWHRSDRCLSPVRPVTTPWPILVIFPWVSKCITNFRPATKDKALLY